LPGELSANLASSALRPASVLYARCVSFAFPSPLWLLALPRRAVPRASCSFLTIGKTSAKSDALESLALYYVVTFPLPTFEKG
jgi:hypothetical protein